MTKITQFVGILSALLSIAALTFFGSCRALLLPLPLSPLPRNGAFLVPEYYVLPRHGLPHNIHPPSSSFVQLHKQPQYNNFNESHVDEGSEIFSSTKGLSSQPLLDPLLTSYLLRSVQNSHSKTSTDGIDTDGGMCSRFTVADASEAMSGIYVWEKSLRKARLPTVDDFSQNPSSWPKEPLFSHIFSILSKLGLPRLVNRHPEITTSILLGVAKIVIEFITAQRHGKLVINNENTMDQEEEGASFNDIMFDDDDDDEESGEDDVYRATDEFEPLSTQELESLAISLADSLGQEWGGIIQGVAQLDKLFGYDHGLLDVKGTDDGFGLNDGIWQHSGWKPMPDLQRRISSIPELRELLSQLGRRPSSKGKDTRRFKERKRSHTRDDLMGVELDILDPSSISTIALSGSLTLMLPTEAVLLSSSIPSLRWLFLAKKAESKLLSYELSGWADVPTMSLPRARRNTQLPSATGGPLIICLDTSHSMSGMRESLSKAVVLASVTMAHKQKRDCRIVSFSSRSNAVECESITCDADGIRRLLDFLSFSFYGGTDVTGALKYVINELERDMFLSDIILVTDGELPNPPVSASILAKLEQHKRLHGLEIHGLLVGKQESESLNLLCNTVHDFLSRYDGLDGSIYLKGGSRPSSLPMARSKRNSFPLQFNPFRKQSSMVLYATHRVDATSDFFNCHVKQHKREGRDRIKKQKYDDYDDDIGWRDTENIGNARGGPKFDVVQEKQMEETEFSRRLNESVASVKRDALKIIEANRLAVAELDLPCTVNKVLVESIAYVESGLIERDNEARLVVLGMVANEHVLFIGPPGTSKSLIGRKLSDLCGGHFFQRLFTRFTTPEEIFGPLSLRALENDQYVRNIDGYLPTANVAFLDEIFKANSAILNTLLTILNERQFDNGAGRRVSCPLKCVIGASNELPDSDELDALLDRFLLRTYVSPVSDDGLMELLSARKPQSTLFPNTTMHIQLGEVIAEISNALDDISIGKNICILIRDLRNFLRDELNIYVSDRRVLKACRLLKLSAASNGRKRVDFIDCILLQHVFWKLPEQRGSIREWLLDNLSPGRDDLVEQTKFLLQGLMSESFEVVKKTMGDSTGEAGARASDLDTIRSIEKELETIERLLQQQHDELERHVKLLHSITTHHWVIRNDAQAFKQYLLPVAEEASVAVRQVLLDITSLKLALTSSSVQNELRSSTIAKLTDKYSIGVSFSEDELQMSLRDAKRQFTGDELRKWKTAKRIFESTSST